MKFQHFFQIYILFYKHSFNNKKNTINGIFEFFLKKVLEFSFIIY